jgi:hypothetical protein
MLLSTSELKMSHLDSLATLGSRQEGSKTFQLNDNFITLTNAQEFSTFSLSPNCIFCGRKMNERYIFLTTTYSSGHHSL